MQKITNLFSNFQERFFTWRQQGRIRAGVDMVMTDHSDSLKKLDLYDKGEISKSQDMVKYPSVREYLQHFQRQSGGNFASRRTSPIV